MSFFSGQRARRLGIAGFALPCVVGAAAAQEHTDSSVAPRPRVASVYLPLDEPACAIIDALQARGELRFLSVLERPYTLQAIQQEVVRDTANSTRLKRGLLRELLREISKYDVPLRQEKAEALRVLANTELYVTSQRSARRELILGDGIAGIYPGGLARVLVQGGAWVVETRIIVDERLKHDPEFTGKKDKNLAGRTEDAYVAGQWRFGEMFFGRLGRNWGPPVIDGLLLGHYVYTYDHVALTLGVPAFHLTTIVARLDDRVIPPDTIAQRYFTIHRLSGRWRAREVAVSEAIIYGGRRRGFDPKWMNPVNGFYLAQLNESPNLYGSVGSDGNLSYRTGERHTRRPARHRKRWIPIGRYPVGMDMIAGSHIPLRLYVAKRRQGEGDYRIPQPPPSQFVQTPTFLSGVVELVFRVGLFGTAAAGSSLQLQGDVGYNQVRNADHIVGRRQAGVQGRIKLSLSPRSGFRGIIDPSL